MFRFREQRITGCPTVIASNAIDSVTKSPNAYNPAFHGKLGYDKQINDDLRLRLTASYYNESSTSSSTLFGGDRTGSHYFFVLENTAATTTGNAFSGRFNPGFTDEVSTMMINPFVKFGGLKFLDSAHVKDLLAALRFAENPRDRIAGFRLLQLMPMLPLLVWGRTKQRAG